MKAKRTFIDFIGESNRLNNTTFKSMEDSIDRIQKELVELADADQDIQVKKIVDGYGADNSFQKIKDSDSESEPESNSKDGKVESHPKRQQLTAEKIVEFIEQALED